MSRQIDRRCICLAKKLLLPAADTRSSALNEPPRKSIWQIVEAIGKEREEKLTIKITFLSRELTVANINNFDRSIIHSGEF